MQMEPTFIREKPKFGSRWRI